ncbi:MAG: tRNA (guanosine(46)-N7)-methyltransferase TrmB [Marinifilaceae bacterium]|nr:tRNA (guanosine(46)-N7)-methyltransferase TrmB [Marinifilaceae bacterium]
MGKNKLKKFAQMETFENVFQPTHDDLWQKDYHLKGKWNKEVFKNDNPIILELGCGKGEYTIGLGERQPETNFIGIDIKGARIWKGALSALNEDMNNVRFIRTKIEMLDSIFAEGEISEVWITFPDPQMKNHKKRLTGSRMLQSYKKFLKQDAFINLKTDSDFLYNYTNELIRINNLEKLEDINDIYSSVDEKHILSIRTFYENQFLTRGITSKYLKFKISNKENISEPDVEIEFDSHRSFGRDRRE